MDFVLRLKFEQHDDLREELLGTGFAGLVEDSDKDAFWGIGPDRKGRNELGKALERLRNKFRTSSFMTQTHKGQFAMTSPTSNALHKFDFPIQTVQSPSHIKVQSPAVHTARLSPNTRSQVDPTQSSTHDAVKSPARTSPRFEHNVLPLSHVTQSLIQPSPYLIQPTQAPIRMNQAPAHNPHVPIKYTQIAISKPSEQDRPLTEQNSMEVAHSFKQLNYDLTESISADLAVKCRIPDCEHPIYYDGTVKSDYCSQQHRQ
ncbi:hypothetical protein C0992_011836 [Termitomyces sp. T32_za158]|nr:hypothetical protein C0992_011836 [Termitomyces sp. T32_za158]